MSNSIVIDPKSKCVSLGVSAQKLCRDLIKCTCEIVWKFVTSNISIIGQDRIGGDRDFQENKDRFPAADTFYKSQ